MKLKEFYENYLRHKARADMLYAYYTDGGKYPQKSISEDDIANAYRKGGLIMEADIIRTSKEEGEGSSVGFNGRGTEYRFIWWCAEIDADQAKIALGIHEALRHRKPKETTETEPNKTAPKKQRARGAAAKTDKKRRTKRRFTL